MSMTPAEMREMAAKVCDDEFAMRKRRMDSGDPNGGDPMAQAHKSITAWGLAKAIRDLPIPDTTAADDALEKAREALEYAIEVFTPPDNQIQVEVATRCRKALTAIDAAKAKGGG